MLKLNGTVKCDECGTVYSFIESNGCSECGSHSWTISLFDQAQDNLECIKAAYHEAVADCHDGKMTAWQRQSTFAYFSMGWYAAQAHNKAFAAEPEPAAKVDD